MPNYLHHKTSNDMKIHIKKVLNMHIENSTLDKYISSIFNLNNFDPTYVFRLPDKKNRTLVFRKSDFTIAVFPNVTNVNKFNDLAELQMSSSIKHPVKVKNEEFFDELKDERLIFENNLSNNFDDHDDDGMKEIVDENVRSEKNFIKFMSDLNADLEEEDLREKYRKIHTQSGNQKQTFSGKIQPKQETKEEEWEEFGLSGWTGSMSASKNEFSNKEKFVATRCLSRKIAKHYFSLQVKKIEKNISSNY